LSVRQQLELKIPPLLLVAISALVMWIVSRTGTSMTVAVPARLIVAGALAAGGIGLVLAGGVAFFRAHTTVNPTRPGATSRVVASGVYRYSRNPMYLGFLLVLAGWAWFLANAASALLLPAFVVCMNRFQIAPEERILGGKFGRDYDEYLRAVRRWL
jgi:protein-S-isoprenylcysteine O-methyltransferase Ste14